MEISKKLDYALRMLAEVAKVSEGEVVSVREVAEANNIPYSFARTIQHEMVRSGLLRTTRGPHGGMMLAVDAKTTTLLDIVEAVDGPLVPSEFVQKNAELAEIGSFDCIWAEIELLVRSYLGSVTLYQVVVEGLAPALRSGYVFEAIPANELAAMRAAKE